MQNRMDEELLDMDIEQDFQILQQTQSQHPDDIYFDNVVMALQEIVVDQQFENLQDRYMKDHCMFFQPGEENKIQYMQIFNKYNGSIQHFLQKSLKARVQNFDMQRFLKLIENRTQRIDQQILEMLMSLSDFQIFKQIILDYRATHEEQERLKILTIKSTKIPQNKKVKGSENIFNNPNQGIFLQGNSDPLMSLKNNSKPKKMTQKKEKTQDQIFLPDLVLTIKPLKKK